MALQATRNPSNQRIRLSVRTETCPGCRWEGGIEIESAARPLHGRRAVIRQLPRILPHYELKVHRIEGHEKRLSQAFRTKESLLPLPA